MGGIGFNFLFIYRIPSWENRESRQEQQGRGRGLLPALLDPCLCCQTPACTARPLPTTGNHPNIDIINDNSDDNGKRGRAGTGAAPGPWSRQGSGLGTRELRVGGSRCGESCTSGERALQIREVWESGSHRSSHPAPEHPSIPPPSSHPAWNSHPNPQHPSHLSRTSVLPWNIHPSCPRSPIPCQSIPSALECPFCPGSIVPQIIHPTLEHHPTAEHSSCLEASLLPQSICPVLKQPSIAPQSIPSASEYPSHARAPILP